MIKVSFIIPVYNVPSELLRSCVFSIMAQTERNIEIILVDDGSTNEVYKVCDELAEKDIRIKVIHQKNKGLSEARNVGVRSSIGEYIAFVDGDDWVETKFVEFLYPSQKTDVVFAKLIKDFPNSQKRYHYQWNKTTVFDSESRFFLQNQILNFNGNISTVCAKLINRSYLIKNNIFHNAKLSQGAEGIEFNFRLFEKVNSAVFINKYVYHYVYDAESITTNPSSKNIKLAIKCFAQIKQTIMENNYSSQNEKSELYRSLDTRLLYFIVTTMISSIWHPKSTYSYRQQSLQADSFVNHTLIAHALVNGDKSRIGFQRQIIIFLVKHKLYLCIKLLSKIKYRNI